PPLTAREVLQPGAIRAAERINAVLVWIRIFGDLMADGFSIYHARPVPRSFQAQERSGPWRILPNGGEGPPAVGGRCSLSLIFRYFLPLRSFFGTPSGGPRQ